MNSFEFDPAASPEANIENFFEHLRAHDAEMAKILVDNLGMIHPLPDGATQRSASRRAFSLKVFSHLQKLTPDQQKEPE